MLFSSANISSNLNLSLLNGPIIFNVFTVFSQVYHPELILF